MSSKLTQGASHLPKAVCLIGGDGFLGRAIRSKLAKSNTEVVIIGRSSNVVTSKAERYVPSDKVDTLTLELSRYNFCAVVDLSYATTPATSYDDPVSDFSANLGATLRHLRLAKAFGCKKFVVVSSGGAVYGATGDCPQTEATLPLPMSPYGITKLACEHYAWMAHRSTGLPVIVVRPANIYGPGQLPFRGQGLVATAIGAALVGRSIEIYGDGRQVRDYLYIDDFVDGMLAVLGAGKTGETYNIGAEIGTTVGGVLKRIKDIALESGRTLNVEWQERRPFDVEKNILDCRRLRYQTGWQPKTTLDEGLRRSWTWMEQQCAGAQ